MAKPRQLRVLKDVTIAGEQLFSHGMAVIQFKRDNKSKTARERRQGQVFQRHLSICKRSPVVHGSVHYPNGPPSPTDRLDWTGPEFLKSVMSNGWEEVGEVHVFAERRVVVHLHLPSLLKKGSSTAAAFLDEEGVCVVCVVCVCVVWCVCGVCVV